MTDYSKPEKEKLLRGEREATMPVRTFYGWLFMSFCFGFVAAVVLAGLIAALEKAGA